MQYHHHGLDHDTDDLQTFTKKSFMKKQDWDGRQAKAGDNAVVTGLAIRVYNLIIPYMYGTVKLIHQGLWTPHMHNHHIN